MTHPPEGDAVSPSRVRRRVTQRDAFLVLAGILGVALVVLIALVIGFLRGQGANAATDVDIKGIRVLLVIDGPGTGRYPLFERPMGVAVGPDRRIYVADSGHDRVCVFDERGRFLFEFGGKGVAKPLPGYAKTWRPGRLNFPVGIAIDEAGDVYVADFRNDQIQVFDPDGRYLRSFPDPLSIVGEGSSGQDGTGIAVTDVALSNGKVYATDAYQVFEFDLNGRFVRQFGKPGRSEGDLDHPNGVAVTSDGNVIVADSNHGRVSAFSDEGTTLWTAGDIPTGPSDRRNMLFEVPRGIAALGSSVAVVDAFRSQVVLVSLDGRVLARFGSRGSAPGEFNFPNDIARLRNDFVIADKDNDRVQVVTLVGWEDATRRTQ